MARRHLAIFIRGVAKKVLNGEKNVEIRLSQSRILPYLAVQKNDEVYLKDTGGKILGKALVENCLYYENLNPEILKVLKEKYLESSRVGEEFWNRRNKAKFASIIFLKNPTHFLTPVVYRKNDRRSWVVMKDNGG